MQNKSKINSLQILRAFAATLVVINHLWGDSHTAISLRLGLQYVGGFGVDAFFVLSGFIMAYKTRDDSRLGLTTAVDFFKKRVERIYPIYLLVLAPFLLIFILKTHTLPIYQIVGNILLLPSFTNDPNYLMLVGPAWTLVYEMIFYVIYAALMLLVNTKKQLILCTFLLLVSIVFIVNGLSLRGPELGLANFSYVMGDPLMINFAFGCVYAQIYRKIEGFTLSIPVVSVLSAALFILGMWLASVGAPRFLGFSLTALAVVCLFSLMKESEGQMYRLLVYIGNASYSIYITHYFFEYSKHFIFNRFPINLDLFGIVCSIIAIIFGCAFYSLIEKRVIKSIQYARVLRQTER